jgi:hypothetical protein
MHHRNIINLIVTIVKAGFWILWKIIIIGNMISTRPENKMNVSYFNFQRFWEQVEEGGLKIFKKMKILELTLTESMPIIPALSLIGIFNFFNSLLTRSVFIMAFLSLTFSELKRLTLKSFSWLKPISHSSRAPYILFKILYFSILYFI